MYNYNITRIDELIEICKKSDTNFIMYGASKIASGVIPILLENHINISGICDSDEKKHGKKHCGIKIISPNDLKKFRKDSIILVSASYIDEISNQLNKMGFRNIYYIPIEFQNSEWDEMVERFLEYIKVWETSYENKDKNVGIVIQPWVFTSVPWFNLTLAYLLYRSKNASVTIIWNDMPFGYNSYEAIKLQNDSIAKVLKVLESYFNIIKLSDFYESNRFDVDCITETDFEKYAELNVIWYLKGETSIYNNIYIDVLKKQLKQDAVAINKILNCNNFNYIIVPGGVYSASCIFLHIADYYGIRVTTYDVAGSGVLMLSNNGVACQLKDIPVAYGQIDNEDIKNEQIALDVRDEIRSKMKGKDKFGYLKGFNKNVEFFSSYILIPLNSSWDSAILGLHGVFKNNIQWLVETVEWIIKNTNENIVIRQHPVERLINTSDNYEIIIRKHFKNNPRITVISANELINTYDLMNSCKFVIAASTTLAIEAVINSKIVITETNSYYSELGFVFKATTKNEYFQLINNAINQELNVTSDRIKRAIKCYYLAKNCNSINTLFNPLNFEQIYHKSVHELMNDSTILDIIYSIDNNIPFCYLQYSKKWNNNLY